MPKEPVTLSSSTLSVLQTLGAMIEERGMSQAELSRRLGVSRSTVIALEKGTAKVSVGTVFEAATIVGIPLLASDQRELDRLATSVANLASIHPERGRRKKVALDDDAIALSPFELPLQPGTFEPTGITTIHCCLRAADARAMIEQLIAAMQDNWLSVCEEAGLATVERDRLLGRVLLNPYCLQDRESA